MSKMNRRAFMSAAASLYVAAPIGALSLAGSVIASPETEDPVFAALRAQNERWLAHGAAIDAMAAAEDTYGFRSPEAKAASTLTSKACHADTQGRIDMLDVVPTTAAGMLAYLAYVESPEGFGDMAMQDDELARLIGTVRRFMTARLEEGV